MLNSPSLSSKLRAQPLAIAPPPPPHRSNRRRLELPYLCPALSAAISSVPRRRAHLRHRTSLLLSRRLCLAATLPACQPSHDAASLCSSACPAAPSFFSHRRCLLSSAQSRRRLSLPVLKLRSARVFPCRLDLSSAASRPSLAAPHHGTELPSRLSFFPRRSASRCSKLLPQTAVAVSPQLTIKPLPPPINLPRQALHRCLALISLSFCLEKK